LALHKSVTYLLTCTITHLLTAQGPTRSNWLKQKLDNATDCKSQDELWSHITNYYYYYIRLTAFFPGQPG